MLVRAIHDQPASQRFRDEGRAIHGQVNAEHQALAADVTDEIEFAGEFFNASTQFRAALANICKQLFFLDYREKFSAAAQTSGPPPNVVPCIPGVKAAANFSLAIKAPSGNPPAKGFATATTSGSEPSA